MQEQKSYQTEHTEGVLYVVPTPIGNLEDITLRALNTLKKVDLIAAEDTRHTKKLLTHFDIHCPLVSYHEHSQLTKIDTLVTSLSKGKSIALVSDAGMPAISDPGTPLVQAAIEQDIPVVVLPGANAALCALVGSGLRTDHFYFYGFLPRKKKERNEAFLTIGQQQSTIILYESPHRLTATLQDIQRYLGNRRIAIARELTKRFEEYVRGTVDQLLEWVEHGTLKGEFCIIIEGRKNLDDEESNWWDDLTINQHVEHYMNADQLPSKMAIKQVAKDRGLAKRDVYQSYHVE